MRRILHRNLMRGHLAQKAAIFLLMGLLLTLLACIYQGIMLLRA
jgi:hypothetical protein